MRYSESNSANLFLARWANVEPKDGSKDAFLTKRSSDGFDVVEKRAGGWRTQKHVSRADESLHRVRMNKNAFIRVLRTVCKEVRCTGTCRRIIFLLI